jgi:hypothetical protein
MRQVARVVATGYPHHIAPRSIPRQHLLPLDADEFIRHVEKTLGRVLRKKKPGPKKMVSYRT